MDRPRAMKVVAATSYGGDVQVRTKESIAQDSGDGKDSCYFCGSLIFSGLLWMQPCTEPPSSKWETMDGVQTFQAAYYPRNTMGALNLKYYTIRRGVCVEIRSCAMDRMQVFPAGRRWRRRRGGGRTPRRRQVELPRLARPNGCFVTSDGRS